MPAHTPDCAFDGVQGIHTGIHIMNIQPRYRFDADQSIELINALVADNMKPLVKGFADIG